MATPRSQLIDNEVPLTYLLVSRCVRRGLLCGTDPLTGQNYDHRKTWLEERLFKLVSCFAVELFGYAIMSNHFHLIVRYDPTAARQWTDEEVVRRWLACASLATDQRGEESLESQQAQLLKNPAKIQRLRRHLGSLSMFMKHLKQPIAWRANREDHCTGHFFEGRFYSGALLDERAVIAALAYVDLHPVRAKMVQRAIEATFTSLEYRLRELAADESRLEEYLSPVVSGLANKEKEMRQIPIRLSEYLDYLEQFSLSETPPDETASWYQRVAMFQRKQRAFGLAHRLTEWATARGWSRIGVAIPSKS